jgi:hypothetical protein
VGISGFQLEGVSASPESSALTQKTSGFAGIKTASGWQAFVFYG